MGIQNNPRADIGLPPQNIPAADGTHITPKTTRPTSHVNGRNSSSGPHRTLPGMSLCVYSTQGYERKTSERSKRKKTRNKFCARSRQCNTEQDQHRPLFNCAKSLYREQAADTSAKRCIFVIGCPAQRRSARVLATSYSPKVPSRGTSKHPAKGRPAETATAGLPCRTQLPVHPA